jgi:hypothetical protein
MCVWVDFAGTCLSFGFWLHFFFFFFFFFFLFFFLSSLFFLVFFFLILKPDGHIGVLLIADQVTGFMIFIHLVIT